MYTTCPQTATFHPKFTRKIRSFKSGVNNKHTCLCKIVTYYIISYNAIRFFYNIISNWHIIIAKY